VPLSSDRNTFRLSICFAAENHELCRLQDSKCSQACLYRYNIGWRRSALSRDPLPCCCTPAGTEDGHIHKCSTSYSEQYLETYHGHIGPVYGLQWSPFNAGLFLSCSGDWTIRMWQEGRQQPLMTFQSSNKEVRPCTRLGMHGYAVPVSCLHIAVISCAVQHPVHNKQS